MERWYQLVQVVIALIAAVALIILVFNFVVTGRDVPTGLLSLLGGIFGAVFAVDAITRRDTKPKNRRGDNGSDGNARGSSTEGDDAEHG